MTVNEKYKRLDKEFDGYSWYCLAQQLSDLRKEHDAAMADVAAHADESEKFIEWVDGEFKPLFSKLVVDLDKMEHATPEECQHCVELVKSTMTQILKSIKDIRDGMA